MELGWMLIFAIVALCVVGGGTVGYLLSTFFNWLPLLYRSKTTKRSGKGNEEKKQN